MPDPLGWISNLPQSMKSIPPTVFMPHYSPEETLLLAIEQGFVPSQMRKQLGRHVERLVDTLQSEGLIVQQGFRQVAGHWCSFYKLTQKGHDYVLKCWARENLF